jgi:hypothetical protein
MRMAEHAGNVRMLLASNGERLTARQRATL